MMFVLMLVLAAFSIACSAAFFSVTGLANTFHGTYWATVVMGSSLEYGKLIATSYLYRYWSVTQWVLRWMLVTLVVVLMLITSIGIFGFLSVGYQTDSLPLKQIEQKVTLLDQEKERLINRKVQIDTQIANLPSDMSKGRIKLIDSFKKEQTQITDRISVLDDEILKTRTQLIQTEAHVGPITYIAKALDLPTDDATKYLIYMIIFVFDPMAVALTLAANIAIKNRQSTNLPCDIKLDTIEDSGFNEPIVENPLTNSPNVDDCMVELDTIDEVVIKTLVIDELVNKVDTTESSVVDQTVVEEDTVEDDTVEDDIETIEESTIDDTAVEQSMVEDDIETIEESTIDDTVVEDPIVDESISEKNEMNANAKSSNIEGLLQEYHDFKNKLERGDRLTVDEHAKYLNIRAMLQKNGFNVYI